MVLPLPTHMVGRLDRRRDGEMEGPGREELRRRIDKRTPPVCNDERSCRGEKDSFLWEGWVDLVKEGGVGCDGGEGGRGEGRER